MRQRLLEIVVLQLRSGAVKYVDHGHLAQRAGVDVAEVERLWPDRCQLLMDAWRNGLGWQAGTADTGSLETDLLAFGGRLIESVQATDGRALFRSSLPIDGDQSVAGVRMDFWEEQFDTASTIVRRAQRRGELRHGVDPDQTARMFCSAIYFNTLYFDAPIPPGYLQSVVDTVLHGVAAKPVGNPDEMAREVAERIGVGEVDLLGQERPAADFSANTAQMRSAILDAAIKEATLRGPEFLTRDVIARRAGVTTAVVERMWKSDADLLRDAGNRAREKTRPVPDTGTLWGDLLSFTEAKATLVSTADARRNYLSTILSGSTGPNVSAVLDFWATGLRESTRMLAQAQQRGDLRDGVNPDFATRILVVSLYYDLFFAGRPMDPAYTVHALAIFLGGISRS